MIDTIGYDTKMPIYLPQPVNSAHPQNRGRAAWWITVPGLYGGNKWYDLCGYNHATLTNMTSTSGWRSTTRQGGYGHLLFDGTNDYAAVPASAVLNLTGNLTFIVWGKTTSSAVALIYGGYNHSAGDVGCGLGYSILNAGKISFYSSGTAVWRGASSTINDGLWHRVGAVLSGSTVTFYRDGLADGTGASAAGGSYTGARAIGADSTGGTPFPGSLDSMTVYPRALSASEMKSDYDLERLGNPDVLNRSTPFTLQPGYSSVPPYFSMTSNILPARLPR